MFDHFVLLKRVFLIMCSAKRLTQIMMGWVRLGQVGLVWVGLVWVGSGWVGSG